MSQVFPHDRLASFRNACCQRTVCRRTGSSRKRPRYGTIAGQCKASTKARTSRGFASFGQFSRAGEPRRRNRRRRRLSENAAATHAFHRFAQNPQGRLAAGCQWTQIPAKAAKFRTLPRHSPRPEACRAASSQRRTESAGTRRLDTQAFGQVDPVAGLPRAVVGDLAVELAFEEFIADEIDMAAAADFFNTAMAGRTRGVCRVVASAPIVDMGDFWRRGIAEFAERAATEDIPAARRDGATARRRMRW